MVWYSRGNAGFRITVSWLHAMDCLWEKIVRSTLEPFGYLDENRLKASGLGRKLTSQEEFLNFCTVRAKDSWTARIVSVFKVILLHYRETWVKNLDHGMTSRRRNCNDQIARCTQDLEDEIIQVRGRPDIIFVSQYN